MNRRSLLLSAPAAIIAAPVLARSLPGPMPVVDAGDMTYVPRDKWPDTWRGPNSTHPKLLSRIWERADHLAKSTRGTILASEYKSRMENVVEKVSGHKPPFIIRNYFEEYNLFIFHKLSDRFGRLEGKAGDHPCYKIEWTDEGWKRTVGELPFVGDINGKMEYISPGISRNNYDLIYDL